MTLSVADFQDQTAHYAYQCATCSARYIVNIRPTAGNGGVRPSTYRLTPGGADEARAMALHCCHDEPEPPNGQNVYWAASYVVGTFAHLHVGDAVIQAEHDAAEEPDEEPEERREYAEIITEIVRPGESAIWGYLPDSPTYPGGDPQRQSLAMREMRSRAPDYECRGFRVDFMPDESADGRRREWIKFLLHARLDVYTGDIRVSPWGNTLRESGFTFVPAKCVDCQHSQFLDRLKATENGYLNDPMRTEDKPDDAPLFHAHARYLQSSSLEYPFLDNGGFYVAARVSLRVQLRYESDDLLPVAFLRLVALGYEIWDT